MDETAGKEKTLAAPRAITKWSLVVYGTMGAKPLRLAQGIAGGVLGPSTYCGGVPTALLGLLRGGDVHHTAG